MGQGGAALAAARVARPAEARAHPPAHAPPLALGAEDGAAHAPGPEVRADAGAPGPRKGTPLAEAPQEAPQQHGESVQAAIKIKEDYLSPPFLDMIYDFLIH